jgi:hypothetical protein
MIILDHWSLSLGPIRSTILIRRRLQDPQHVSAFSDFGPWQDQPDKQGFHVRYPPKPAAAKTLT